MNIKSEHKDLKYWNLLLLFLEAFQPTCLNPQFLLKILLILTGNLMRHVVAFGMKISPFSCNPLPFSDLKFENVHHRQSPCQSRFSLFCCLILTQGFCSTLNNLPRNCKVYVVGFTVLKAAFPNTCIKKFIIPSSSHTLVLVLQYGEESN